MNSPKAQVLAIVLAAGLTSCTSSGRISQHYDKFSQNRTVSLDAMSLPGPGMSVGMYVSLVGSRHGDGQAPSHATLKFSCVWDNWQFRDSHELWFLIDGERYSSSTKWHGEITRTGYAYEELTTSIAVSGGSGVSLEKIAQATSVEGRIGCREFVLGPTQRKKIGEFITTLQASE